MQVAIACTRRTLLGGPPLWLFCLDRKCVRIPIGVRSMDVDTSKCLRRERSIAAPQRENRPNVFVPNAVPTALIDVARSCGPRKNALQGQDTIPRIGKVGTCVIFPWDRGQAVAPAAEGGVVSPVAEARVGKWWVRTELGMLDIRHLSPAFTVTHRAQSQVSVRQSEACPLKRCTRDHTEDSCGMSIVSCDAFRREWRLSFHQRTTASCRSELEAKILVAESRDRGSDRRAACV